MCAIIGIVSFSSPVCRELFIAGRDAMAHRGPNDAGAWWSTNGMIALGHRRLSVMDPSSNGHQPMQDRSNKNLIVFNGEIYNFKELRLELILLGHTFVSDSDTEVILAAYSEWGVDCIKRFNGMFAFGILDQSNKILFLARDRVGEKPLFYYQDTNSFRFSSELKGLLVDPSLPRQIDHGSLDCYLYFGFVPGAQCMLRGFSKLKPAHALTVSIETGDILEWCYWNLPTPPHGKALSFNENELLEKLEDLIEDSVRRQMIADVPVGVLLSGGVDSSLITAMAARSSSNIQTFTVCFPGYKQEDESGHARLVANYFGTKHTELVAEGLTEGLLPCLARQFDEPMADSSMIPTYLVSQLVATQCVVALGGDGGDELFGGYQHYSNLQWIQNNLGWTPKALRKSMAYFARQFLPVGMRGRNYFFALETDLKTELPLTTFLFDKKIRGELLSGLGAYRLVGELVHRNTPLGYGDIVQRATRSDFLNYLPEDILVKIDRASMLSSLEVRSPMLDHRIIEFAMGSIPSHLKATQGTKKVLLKRLTETLLPPTFDRRRKQGFSIPLDEWIRKGPFRHLVREVLLSPGCAFNKTTVTRLFHEQDKGFNNGERLFSLALFELWRKEYSVKM